MPSLARPATDPPDKEIEAYDRDVYQQEKQMDSAAQSAAAEQACISGFFLYKAFQNALENGAFDALKEEAGDAVEAADEALKQFAEDGLKLGAEVIQFIKDNAPIFMEWLSEELIPKLLHALKCLAEFGMEIFKVIGHALETAAAELGKAVELIAEKLGEIPWGDMGESMKEFCEAAGEAAQEAGKNASGLLLAGWEALSPEEREAAAGGAENAAGITKGLEEAAATGKCDPGFMDAIGGALKNIMEKLTDNACNALQKAVGVLAKLGDEAYAFFVALWDKIQELIPELIEMGKGIAPIVLAEVGTALEMVEDFAKESQMVATVSEFADAIADAAKENAQIAGALLADSFEKLIDSGAFKDAKGEVMRALNRMKEEGLPLVGKSLKLVKCGLETALKELENLDIKKLQQAVAVAAQAGLAGMQELFKLIKEAVQNLKALGKNLENVELPSREEVKQAAEKGLAIAGEKMDQWKEKYSPAAIAFAIAAKEAIAENAQLAAEKLQDAINKLIESGVIQEISVELQEGLQKLKEEALPLAEEAVDEIKSMVEDHGLLEKLENADLQDLAKSVKGLAAAGLETGKELADIIGTKAKEILDFTQANAGDWLANGAVIAKEGFGELDDMYQMSRDELDDMLDKLQGVGDCCGKAFDLIKLEIFRDVFQAIGLFMTRLFRGIQAGLTKIAMAIWGTIGAIMAVDFGNILDGESMKKLIVVGIVLLVIIGIIVICCFFWFVSKACGDQQDTLREGHETETWKEKTLKAKKTVEWMTKILTVSLSCYLPLATLVVEILNCDPAYNYMLFKNLKDDTWKCSEGPLIYIAIFFLAIFVVPLPFLSYWLIEKNKPTGSPEDPDVTYDEDGQQVPFTDQIYHERVERDPEQIACPYRSLYKGYERRWSFYKVAIMMFKLFIVLPVVFLTLTKDASDDVAGLYYECKQDHEDFCQLESKNQCKCKTARRALVTSQLDTILSLSNDPIGQYLDSPDHFLHPDSEFSRFSKRERELKEYAAKPYLITQLYQNPSSFIPSMLSIQLPSFVADVVSSISAMIIRAGNGGTFQNGGNEKAIVEAAVTPVKGAEALEAKTFVALNDETEQFGHPLDDSRNLNTIFFSPSSPTATKAFLDNPANSAVTEKQAYAWMHSSCGMSGGQTNFLPLENKDDCDQYFAIQYDQKPNPGQGIATFGIVLFFALFSTYSTPFIDPNADLMDASGRIAMSCTCLVAIALVQIEKDDNKSSDTTTTTVATTGTATTTAAPADGDSGAQMVMGLILNVVQFINFVVMMYVLAFGFPCFRAWVKNYTGKIHMSNTCSNERLAEPVKVLKEWDVEREVKHRVWHTFWNGVLLNGCGEEVAERMLELKDQTRKFGLEKIRLHWSGFAKDHIRQLRMHCRQNLEGVDLFWDHPTGTLDGKLDSATCFGKMYIDPYPFHLVVIYDDCDDASFIWEENDLQRFVDLQTKPNIVEAKENRLKIRSLAKTQVEFAFPFERWEQHTIPDGTESCGEDGKDERQAYSTVNVLMSYTNGRVSLAFNTSKNMAAGFTVSMQYNDGTGEAHKPREGGIHHFSNMSANMGHDHMGINNQFSTSPRFQEFLEASQHLWPGGMDPIKQEWSDYRVDLIKKLDAKGDILGNGFWYFVYNNDRVSSAGLNDYFLQQEPNPVLKEFPTKHKAGLRFLYLRMNYCLSNPVSGLWYIFWDDIWTENKEMAVFENLKDDIDPNSANSIAYKPKPRDQLEEWLKERNLYGSARCRGGDSLFFEKTLDALYERIEVEKEKAGNNV